MRKIGAESARIRVPLRKVSHEERVRLGRRIASQILKKYNDAILAVCIYASTGKKLDRPYSDFEMLCITKDNVDIPNRFYLYHGLLVEIDYSQESNFLKEARKVGYDWHLGADQFRNRIVLFERNRWLNRLKEALRENEKADFKEELRWSLWAMTEALSTVRNALLKGDIRDLRTRAFYMAWDTARVIFYYNRKYVLTSSWFWRQLFECRKQPENLRSLIDVLAGFEISTQKQIAVAAEELWKNTMAMVLPRRLSIESRKIIV